MRKKNIPLRPSNVEAAMRHTGENRPLMAVRQILDDYARGGILLTEEKIEQLTENLAQEDADFVLNILGQPGFSGWIPENENLKCTFTPEQRDWILAEIAQNLKDHHGPKHGLVVEKFKEKFGIKISEQTCSRYFGNSR